MGGHYHSGQVVGGLLFDAVLPGVREAQREVDEGDPAELEERIIGFARADLVANRFDIDEIVLRRKIRELDLEAFLGAETVAEAKRRYGPIEWKDQACRVVVRRLCRELVEHGYKAGYTVRNRGRTILVLVFILILVAGLSALGVLLAVSE
jgi:hypothetical protein